MWISVWMEAGLKMLLGLGEHILSRCYNWYKLMRAVQTFAREDQQSRSGGGDTEL
jgi:hypothetical protein